MINHLKPTFLALAALAFFIPSAQAAEETLAQKVATHLDGKSPQRFITITEENDKYGGGTDKNYTNGSRITWFDTGAKPPAFIANLADAMPGFSVNETTSIYYALGQSMFTPEDKTRSNPDPRDRPYAGYLYGTAGLVSVTGNHVDNLDLTLGVVGPASFARQTQTFIHGIVGAHKAKGWDHQLKNEPALTASWQRLWPEAQALDAGGFRFRVSPYTGATLGNVYTYGSTGVMFQIVPEKYKWQSNPLRVQPAIPGNGYFDVPDNRFAWSLFFGLEGRAMARNIFLDGNTFADSRSVDKKYFVGDANAGVSLTYGRVQVSYTLNWRSEEFQGQDGSALFGALSAGYRF